MKTVICTTGTSIVSGIEPDRIHASAIRSRLKRLQDGSTPEQYLINASAESHSLFRMGLDDGDVVHLLHSETDDGRTCAQALRTLIVEELVKTVHVHEVSGLQVLDRDRFRRVGIATLFEILDSIARPCLDRGQGRNVYLNVTGGFKAVVPYATLFGLLYRLPVVYIFERSAALLTLPPAAINFDFERLSQVDGAMQRLIGEGAMHKDEFLKAIPNLDRAKRDWVYTLLDEDDEGYVTLSAFGLLASRVVKREFSPVYLSREARAAYDRASGDVRRRFDTMLDRAANPVWRLQKAHPFAGTNLTVLKPGNISERMAGFIQNDNFYVCELYQHDRYERDLLGRKTADYPLGSFNPWTMPPDQPNLPRSEEEDFRQLEDELREAKELLEIGDTEQSRLRDEAEEWRGRCERLERELGQYHRRRAPWWKRITRR